MDLRDPGTWPPEALSDANVQARAEKAKRCAARKDVLGWLRAVSPRTYHLPPCELHEYQVATRHEAESGLEAPRYHAKTAIGCAGIPLYQACEEPELYDYVLNVQANEKKALALNMGIKLEFEQNPVLRRLYGDLTGRDKWTDSLFVLRSGVAFQAATTGQSLKGTNYRLRRPNYVLLDDAYDDSHIRNPEATQGVNDWVESTLEPMLANDRPSIWRWQGTAVNDVDGMKRLEEKSRVPGSTTKFRRFCAFGEFRSEDGGQTQKWFDTPTVLWPQLRSYAGWKAKQLAPGVNQTIFNREHLNVRGGDSEAVVHEEWLNVPGWEYDGDVEFRFGVDHVLLAITICCDPSVGKKQENDPTGFAVILKTQRTDGKNLPVYWIDALRNERLSPQKRIDQMKDWIRLYRARFPQANSFEVRIETVAGFMDFGDQASSQLDAPVTCLPQATDKLAHLESKAILLQNRRVRLNKHIDGILKTTLKHQVTTNYPTNDDLRDALLIGLDPSDTGLW
jgi:hypothetical protein